ncbi:MAG: hypothetical protein OQK57_01980 [Ignavibacteriaceae bacterium]|nr:hypothetical protein [Ignavibacteriaceae bacterium]
MSNKYWIQPARQIVKLTRLKPAVQIRLVPLLQVDLIKKTKLSIV